MLEPRDENQLTGLVANRFKLIRSLRPKVYHARDGRRHVAIEMVPRSEHDLVRLRAALAIANTIDHPNLCRPREVVQANDQLIIVTELVDGVSIGDRLVVGPFDPLQVGALMVELLSVLVQVHAAGLAHGSISPSTVMIDATGALRLMDLGVVRGTATPTVRGDLEACGALAATMLTGYLGSVPAQLTGWIASCSDPKQPFADAAAARSARTSSHQPRPPKTRTLMGMPQPARIAKPERSESSVAIKIPTLDEPVAKPLEVIVTMPPMRRGRTPSALIKTSEAIAAVAAMKTEMENAPSVPTLDELVKEAALSKKTIDFAGAPADPKQLADGSTPEVTLTSSTRPSAPSVMIPAKPDEPEAIEARPVEAKPLEAKQLEAEITTVEAKTETEQVEARQVEPTPEDEATPADEAAVEARSVVVKIVVPSEDAPPPRRSRLWLAGGLAAAAGLLVWWKVTAREPEPPPPPSVTWVSEPIEMPPTPAALRPKPPLPTGAVLEQAAVPAARELAKPVEPPAASEPPKAIEEPPPKREVAAPEPITATADGEAAVLEVPFAAEAAWLDKQAVYVLEEAYRQLIRNPLARVEVIGHSSNDGDGARNAQLAVGRAISVKNYLVQRGVDETRIAIGQRDLTTTDPANARRADVRILPR